MTSEIYSIQPLIAIFLPWISLVFILIMPRIHRRLKGIIHILVSLVTFGIVLSFLPDILDGRTFGISIVTLVEQINIHLAVDALGYYFGLVITFIWLITTIYSVGYIDHRENRYYGFMALSMSFILGCAFSQNMFTYFIFYELMTLSTYPLIIHEETDAARRAGIKYLKYAIPAGAVILFATLFHYFWGGGNLSLMSSGTLSLATTSRTVLMIIFFAYIAGFGVKAAIIPLEGWVPDAHPAAPSPASAVLSGIILKAGAFGIIRVVLNIFGPTLFKSLNLWIYLAVIAGVTMILASIRALRQDNLKRRLAYSSISQVSYILFGLSLVSYDGSLGGIIHLAHHGIMKACLFLCAGIILLLTGKRNVSELEGIGYRIPITMTCFTICALAMFGTPPSIGFISKWFIGSGALQADQPILIIVLLVSALLNATYYFPIIYNAFFKRPIQHHPRVQLKDELSSIMLWPILILTVMVIFAGIWITIPGFPYSLVNKFVANIFQ